MIKVFFWRFFISISLVVLTISPVFAQAESATTEEEPAVELTPNMLGDALSCRSHDAALDFAAALFLQYNPPAWMHKVENEKNTEGMIGLYGYKLDTPALLLGQPVETVYFMKDWVVTLWPREKALAFIASQKMQRAPINVTEQYYRFIDAETGPMLGVFEPTGNAIEQMIAKASGAELPKTPASDVLFVGCNYSPVSQKAFLEAASQSEGMMKGLSNDFNKMINENK